MVIEINAYTENQKETVEISSINKECLEILNLAGHIENDIDSVSYHPHLTFVWMDGRIGCERRDNVADDIKSHKG